MPRSSTSENEGAVGRDLGAGAGGAIGEVGGNGELEFVAYLHELEATGPFS